jgi:transcription elongation factor Elf1
MTIRRDRFACFFCKQMTSHWNAYLMIRVPEKEEYTMLLCDNCSNTFAKRLKDTYENEEGFAEYAEKIRRVNWHRIWKHEQDEWEKMK